MKKSQRLVVQSRKLHSGEDHLHVMWILLHAQMSKCQGPVQVWKDRTKPESDSQGATLGQITMAPWVLASKQESGSTWLLTETSPTPPHCRVPDQWKTQLKPAFTAPTSGIILQTVYASNQNSIPLQHLWSLIRAIKEYKDAIMTTLKGSHPFSSDGVTGFSNQDYGGASVLNEGEEETRS